MNSRRRIFWWVFLPLCLLAAVVPAAITYWRHTVPLAECSEVYRQYRHQPGVRAAFIRQMPINDTLRLDMTLLEAEDSAAFAGLLIKMGKSEEFINDIMSSIVNENTRFIRRIPKGHPELPRSTDNKDNELMAIFPAKKIVAIIHTKEHTELHDAMISNLREEFNVKKTFRTVTLFSVQGEQRHLPARPSCRVK